jgi:prepilin-type N-terminal cleavage/methylation domain-containing protein
MNKTLRKTSAFTLIELLMVIAIIGILAGILIPTIGAVRKQANIAASKAQLSNYVNAIQMFKGEYSYFPFVTGGTDYEASINTIGTETFITTLSGRDSKGVKPTSSSDAALSGNRRMIGFYSFSESEYLAETTTAAIVDRFDNDNIVIVIDGSGDGKVTPAPKATNIQGSGDIRTTVTAYTDTGTVETDDPTYALWD